MSISCRQLIAAPGIVAIAASLSGGCGPRLATAGFCYEDTPFALPAVAAEQLGGRLTDGELDSIKTFRAPRSSAPSP